MIQYFYKLFSIENYYKILGIFLCCTIYPCVLSRSAVWDSAILWIVARQAPLSTGFSRQEHWSGLPFPSLGGLPDPVIQPLPWVSVLLSLSLASEAEEENHAICACGPQRTVFWPTAHCLSAVPLSALSTALLYPNPSGTTFTCITTCLLRHHGAQRHPWLPPQPALPPSLLPSRPHQEPASSSQPL